MIDALIRAVRGRSRDLGVAPPTDGMVVGIDRDPGAKVTVLLFDAAGRLTAVAKTTRSPGADVPLRAEHDMLAGLGDLPLATVRPQVPRALLLEGVAGRTVLVTAALPGGPMTVGYHRPGHVQRPVLVAADFAAAGGWLAAFQHETRQGEVSCPDAFERYAVPAFDRYRAAFGWGEPEERLVAQCVAGVERHARSLVPLCAVHGDFAPGNLLVEDAGARRTRVCAVVDWERGRRRGPALTDLFKFAASYGSFLDRAAPFGRHGLRGHPGWADVRDRVGGDAAWPNLVGFLYAFTGQGWFPDLVRGYLAAGYERLGVPVGVQAVFLPAFVAEQATTLSDPVYRRGYRDLLHALDEGRSPLGDPVAGGLR